MWDYLSKATNYFFRLSQTANCIIRIEKQFPPIFVEGKEQPQTKHMKSKDEKTRKQIAI